MLLRKLFFLFSIPLLHFAQAQKTKTDTVYVYEKIIVYDTIYLEKPIQVKPKDISMIPLGITDKEIKDLYKENTLDNTVDHKKENQPNTKFQYGFEAGIGLKKSNWAKELSGGKQQFGENIGIWLSKSILNPKLSLMLSANVYHWNSTFDLDANKEDTYLNGYYFTDDHQPLLFQKFNNKHFEYSLQLKIVYEWIKIRPFVGLLATRNTYNMQFLVPENNVLDKLDDFKSKQYNLGFSFGAQYQLNNRFILSVDYQQYKIKNISLKNSSFDFDIFKTSNTFAERKINLGILYIISR